MQFNSQNCNGWYKGIALPLIGSSLRSAWEDTINAEGLWLPRDFSLVLRPKEEILIKAGGSQY